MMTPEEKKRKAELVEECKKAGHDLTPEEIEEISISRLKLLLDPESFPF